MISRIRSLGSFTIGQGQDGYFSPVCFFSVSLSLFYDTISQNPLSFRKFPLENLIKFSRLFLGGHQFLFSLVMRFPCLLDVLLRQTRSSIGNNCPGNSARDPMAKIKKGFVSAVYNHLGGG